jgi:hypothetical protein
MAVLTPRSVTLALLVAISATAALVWIWGKLGIGGFDVVAIVATAITLFGTVLLERVFTTDDGGRRIQNPRVVVMLWAALGASAVSFLTSLFGLFEFANASSSGLGMTVVNWVIAGLTTFVIQIGLLAVSLELGQQAQKMRPMPGDDYVLVPPPRNPLSIGQAEARRNRFKAAIVIAAGALLIVMTQTGGSLESVARQILGFLLDQGANRNAYVAYGIATIALIVPFWMGWLKVPRVLRDSGVLLGLFGFFLILSVVFSFDNFYRLFQSNEDETQRRGAVIRETVPGLLFAARRSLENEAAGLLATAEGTDFVAGMIDGMNGLVRTYRDNLDVIAGEIVAQRQRAADQGAAIDGEIKLLEGRRTAEIQATLAMLGDVPTLESTVEALKEEIAQLESERDELSAEVQRITDEINEQVRLARCEEFGSNDPTLRCEGTTGVKECRTECEKYKKRAKDLTDVSLAAANTALESNRKDRAARAKALRDAEVQLQAAVDRSEPTDGGESPVVTAQREINLRYDGLIAQKRAEQSNLYTYETRSQTFSIDDLAEAFARFRAAPSRANAEAFSLQCDTARTQLANSGVTDAAATTFNCAPPQLGAIAARADNYEKALVTFDAACEQSAVIDGPLISTKEVNSDAPSLAVPGPEGNGLPSPGADSNPSPALAADAQAPEIPDPGAAQNSLSTLRGVIDRTRACMSTLNFGQPGVVAGLQQLTELESTYLVQRLDMRSSLADLQRGNFFAVFAFVLAVGGDLMVAIMGAWAAYKSDSPLLRNPFRPDADRVEQALSAAAAFHSPDGTPAPSMQRFVSYLYERRLENDDEGEMFFRSAITLADVPQIDRPMVDAILRAIPTRWIKDDVFHGLHDKPGAPGRQARAIAQNVVEMMQAVAQSRPLMHSRSAGQLRDYLMPRDSMNAAGSAPPHPPPAANAPPVLHKRPDTSK